VTENLTDWIPQLPEAWTVAPFYTVFQERVAENKGLVETNLLSLSYGVIVRKDVESNHGLLPASFDGYNIVESNDIVMRLTDMQNDQRSLRTGQVRERGIITSAYVTVTPSPALLPRFAHYLLHGYDLAKVYYRMGGGLRQSMKYGDLRRLPIMVPPKSEQESIANFLDEQTARTDALIAEKERLCDLIVELDRESLRTELLPKGALLSKAKWAINLSSGTAPPASFDKSSGKYPVYGSNGPIGRCDEFTCSEGTIVVGRVGSCGAVAVLPEASWVSDNALVIQAGTKVIPAFLALALEALELSKMAGGTAMPLITGTMLKDQKIWVPSLEVQRDKAASFNKKREGTFALLTHTRQCIQQLREYRTSLISAAVTGQLDINAYRERT
jgi:type I restriction enzyme S subunit